MPLSLTAADDDSGRRLDRILRKAMRGLPLSAIHRLLRQGSVLVDGKKKGADYRVQSGQTITVNDASDIVQEQFTGNSRGSSGSSLKNLNILFEGGGLLVLNKPAGIAVHGKDSLEDEVLAYLKPKLPPSLSFRPGPLHRLDKPSSGVIVFSASLEGARFFSALLRERKIKKQYLAIVEGIVENEETWQDELARSHAKEKTFTSSSDKKPRQPAGQPDCFKTALTRIKPLAHNADCTLLLAEIETGRTHQIRAQAASHGCPLLGDKKYGGKSFCAAKKMDDNSFLLHAWRVEFPENERALSPALPRSIEAPLPERFSRKITELFGEIAIKTTPPANKSKRHSE